MDFGTFLHTYLDRHRYIYCDTIEKQNALMDCLHAHGVYGDECLEQYIAEGNPHWTIIGSYDGERVHANSGRLSKQVDGICFFDTVAQYIFSDDDYGRAGSAVDMLIS